MGMTTEGASYMVLSTEDQKMLEEVAARIVNARGSRFIYNTQAGVRIIFDPPIVGEYDANIS